MLLNRPLGNRKESYALHKGSGSVGQQEIKMSERITNTAWLECLPLTSAYIYINTENTS